MFYGSVFTNYNVQYNQGVKVIVNGIFLLHPSSPQPPGTERFPMYPQPLPPGVGCKLPWLLTAGHTIVYHPDDLHRSWF